MSSHEIHTRRPTWALLLPLLFCANLAWAQAPGQDPLQWPQGCDAAEADPDGAAAVRIPALNEAQMNAEEKQAAQSIASGPRGCIFGPFSLLARSPELLNRAQKLGEYLRFHAALPMKERELAMLITGRVQQSQYVWYIHEPIALKAGVSRPIVEDLAAGKRPAAMDGDEAAVYDFLEELANRHAVGDAAYTAVRSRFGEKGTLDLVGIYAYFSLLALEMNVAGTPLPKGVKVPFAQVH